MNARDFGVTDNPWLDAKEDVRPHLGLSGRERYRRFLDLMGFLESVWKAVEPARRARYDRVNAVTDDPGRWWERVPNQ